MSDQVKAAPMWRRWVLRALGLLWGLGILGGFALLLRYDATAGFEGNVGESWPAGSSIPRDSAGSTLLMIAHPKCPCTRASLSELGEIMDRCGQGVRAIVLFVLPRGSDSSWESTDLVARANQIPGVEVRFDRQGAEARRFGTMTSGHTLLYDRDGVLRFSGGITKSRGHTGANSGRSAIIDIVENRPVARGATHVYGCALLGQETDGDTLTCCR